MLFLWKNLRGSQMWRLLTAWNILQIVHKGTKAVKINKLLKLTSRFESIRMSILLSIWVKFMINQKL